MPARVERWLPPRLVDALRGRFGQVRFHGDYENWAQAMRDCAGYETRDILERVRNASLAVKEGRAAYERDAVTFDHVQRQWPVLASLLWIASQRAGRLHVLDFGGALGSSYREHRDRLSQLSLRWSIVEQPHFVAAGRAQFEDAQLRFYSDASELDARPDVLFLSSVLSYVEDPYRVLEGLLHMAPDFVLIDRTPILPGHTDRLTVQRVSARMGKASYPAWFFARANFLRAFAASYRLIEEFDSLDRANIPSRYQGFLFQRRGEHAR